MKALRNGGWVLAALVLLGGAGGCANRMHDENRDLHSQNRELQARLDAEREAMEREEAAQMQPMTPAPQPPAPSTQQAPPIARTTTPTPPQIPNTETISDPEAGTVTVRVLGDLLFDPGQATIRTAGKTTLDNVAAALKKDYPGKQIRVEGHTDADPIRVSKWKSNQELSEARAAAVKQYLGQKGVENGSLTTRGFAADKPRSKTDKSLNRRVEIVVVTR